MIMLKLHQAQIDLPALAEKALAGKEVIIAIGTRRLRLLPVGSETRNGDTGPRPGRGALRRLLSIPDAFYEPWTHEEMGE